MGRYLLSLDEGTTSARAILFDSEMNIVNKAQHEFPQIYPKPGWVEHDPLEIYACQYSAMTECVAKSNIDPGEIAAIGITNQRETTILWEKATGKPVYNAIVWQCRRTADICEWLLKEGYYGMIQAKTGLRPDAYFSGTKIKWILDNTPGLLERAKRGEILFGTIDTWLLWKLTNGKVHATDKTNASRTMIYNIHTNQWDKELLDLLNIPEQILPEVKDSSDDYGETEIMGATIPIRGVAGDQQAALFGQKCFTAGTAKNTYGTGCFLLTHTGNVPVTSSHGMLTTIAATEKGRKTEYALEGSVFVGGAVIQWLRDELKIIKDSGDCEAHARKVADSGGVYIVPAFAGLGAPYWDMHARGTITGLTRGTNRDHIIRAAVESTAYQVEDLLSAMAADMGTSIKKLLVDGGATRDNFLLQFQSDISNLEVIRTGATEATSEGVAFLAGLYVGFFRDKEEILNLNNSNEIFKPSIDSSTRESLLEGWHRAVSACRHY